MSLSSFSYRWLLALLAVVGLSGVLLAVLPQATTSLPQAQAQSSVEGITLPTAQTVKPLLPELASKPVVLEFSSSYCGYCRRLAPTLHAVAKRYPKIALVVIDSAKDMGFASKRERTQALLEAFEPQATPTFAVINQQGQVIHAQVGAPDEAGVDALFKKASVQK